MSFDKVIALTLHEKKMLESLGFKRIEVIPNAVDTNVFKPLNKKSLKTRKRHGISRKEFVVLFLGRLASNKGIPYLINAFKEIKTEKKKLLIAGKENPAFFDTRYKYYASIAEKLNVHEKIIFAKNLSEEEVVDALNSSDVLVLPSIASEAFGLVLIEAMACGKPVIGTSIEGIKEVIIDGFNGFVVSPKKSSELAVALELLTDNSLKRKMGCNGLSLVKQRYSLNAVSESHLKVYLEFY
jgi:glycosyltransferase involved in cell wall biosynthesis